MERDPLLLSTLVENLNGQYKGYSEKSSCYEILIQPDGCHDLLDALFRDNNFWCDHLISLSGEHVKGEKGIIKIHYHVTSLTKGWVIHIQTERILSDPQEIPEFDSVSDIWKSANWHERETAELYGIHFKNHPDLRKLLLPSNWEGFPLRKDYMPQEFYHGVKVKF